MTKGQDYQYPPKEGFILAHFLTVADVKRSAEFYGRVFGGELIKEGEPTYLKIANSWLIINVGGGPTPDKPDIILETPKDKTKAANFMNIRVADIWSCYNEWQKKGAEFITEPKLRSDEIRCYIRDPDGYIIEVGQSI